MNYLHFSDRVFAIRRRDSAGADFALDSHGAVPCADLIIRVDLLIAGEEQRAGAAYIRG